MANQNVTQLTQQTVSAAPSSLFYAVTGGTTDTGLPLSVFVNNLGLTGIPTVPTATTGTNTTQIASTAFVQAQLTSSLAPYAPLASPAFTGTPTAPTLTLSSTTGLIVSTATNSQVQLNATGSSVSVFNNSSNGNFGFFNNTTVKNTLVFSETTDSATFVGLIIPATAIGIKGTTVADNVQAGSVGEVITATASGVAQTSATLTNVTSVSLTAGDWDVAFSWNSSTATSFSGLNFGVTTTTAGQAPIGQRVLMSVSGTGGFEMGGPTVRFNLASTTTILLTSAPTFTGSATVGGTILARRRR